MGLTKEQQKEREQDEHVKYITSQICNNEGDDSYVFISYKSDDWKDVLHDIVYTLVKDYHLNVYFDGDFDGHNPLWTTQFPKNMEDPKCKGVLAFVSDKYTTSYATLMELMYSQAGCQDKANDYEFISKKVIPIYLNGDLKVNDSDNDTGLGKGVFDDGTANEYAQDELKLFDKTFRRACRKFGIFEESEEPYEKAKKERKKERKSPLLSHKLCNKMVRELIGYIKSNKNYYKGLDSLEGIVASIKDACEDEVFQKKNSKLDGSGVYEPESSVPESFGLLPPVTPEPVIAPPVTPEPVIPPVVVTPVHPEPPIIGDPPVFPQPPEPDHKEQIWTYKTTKGAFARLLWDGESKRCTVLTNSKTAYEAAGFASLPAAKKLKDDLIAEGVLVNDRFVRDYDCDKIATMINVLNGGSVSMPGEIQKGRLAPTGEASAQPPVKNTPDVPVQLTSNLSQDTSLPVGGQTQIKESPLIIPSYSNGAQTTAPTWEPERLESCTMSLAEFSRKYNNSNFKKNTFEQIRLKTADGSYVGEFWNSTRDLVWQFMMKLIKDNGEAVMQQINMRCPGSNPIFIPANQMSKYKVSYSKTDVMPDWAMCTNYSQADWLRHLKKCAEAVGFRSEDLQLEFQGFCA